MVELHSGPCLEAATVFGAIFCPTCNSTELGPAVVVIMSRSVDFGYVSEDF